MPDSIEGENGRPPGSPFVRKLRYGAPLTDDDEEILAELSRPTRRGERQGDILLEGTEPRSIVLILDGWACRYKQLENGKRQIVTIYLPGDLCEPFGVLLPRMDHSLGALTPVVFAQPTPATVRSAIDRSSRIEKALWWDLMAADAILRENIVSLGRRSATERLGHLFCELHLRLGMVGLADQVSYELPLTQTDLGDLLGLSSVHVNRSLQELRAMHLLTLRQRRLTISDLRGLRDFSMFDPTYLHFDDKIDR